MSSEKKSKGFFTVTLKTGFDITLAGKGFKTCSIDVATIILYKCEYISDNYLDAIKIGSYICNPLRKRRIVLRKSDSKF